MNSKKSAFRLGAVAVMAFGLLTASLTTVSADTMPMFGAKCPTEGVSTGQASTSLICVKGSNGVLAWAKVRLSSNGQAPVAALHANPGSIEFHHFRAEDKAVFQTIIDQFQAINPGVKITQVIMSSGDYTNLALSKIKANPKAALFAMVRGGQFNDFYAAGLLKDLSAERFLKQNVVSSALTPGLVNGSTYGLPYQSLFNDPLYNVSMFAKYGWTPPKTWTELLGFCKKVKAAGIIPFAWPAATRGNAGQIMNSFLMNSAPDVATLTSRIAAIDTGKADLNQPWFVEIANKYKAMNDAGCFPANVTGYNDTVAPADFASGKAAIYPTGTFGMSTVTNLNPAMKGNMKVMSMITVDDKPLYMGITNNTFILGVNAKSTSRDQNIARAFMSYLATAPVAQQYAVGTSQHVSIVNVDYSANIDLLNTSDIMGKKLLLAPRFLFNNVTTVRNVVEDALIAIGGGADITKTLADASKTIKQNLGA